MIGELWAVSISLRIVLIENLRRLAEQTVTSRMEREHADALADRILGTPGQPPEPIAAAISRYQHQNLSEAFAVQMAHRLRDQDPAITPALTWLDDRLLAQDMTVDAAVREVHRRQGASNVSVRNTNPRNKGPINSSKTGLCPDPPGAKPLDLNFREI